MAAAPKIATVRRQWDNAFKQKSPLKTGSLLRDSYCCPIFLFDFLLKLMYNFYVRKRGIKNES